MYSIILYSYLEVGLLFVSRRLVACGAVGALGIARKYAGAVERGLEQYTRGFDGERRVRSRDECCVAHHQSEQVARANQIGQ